MMRKKIFWWLKKIILLVLWLLLLFFVFEHINNARDNMSVLWTNIESPVTEYEVTHRASHLAYLETFNYEGHKIRYLDRGNKDGTPLLLVHGTPTNSWLWRKMAPGLVAAWYRVIAPDQFGFWASDKYIEEDLHTELSTAKQSQRLIALMDHLDISTFAIAGHDQWSLWVWETITSIPDRISHLVIFNSIWTREWFHPPAWFGSVNMGTKFTGWAMGSKLLWRVFAYGAMVWWLKNIKHANLNMVHGYLMPLLNDMNHSYYDFITHFDEIQTQLPDRHEKFKQLDIPTTIIRWKHDKILVGEEQTPVLAELFKVKPEDIHLLESGAHFIQEEIPTEINTIITQFVK